MYDGEVGRFVGHLDPDAPTEFVVQRMGGYPNMFASARDRDVT